MVRSAYIKELVDKAKDFGVERGDSQFSWAKAQSRMRAIRDLLIQKKDEKLAKWGIDFFPFEASFVSPHQVEVDGEIVEADKFIIASGSKVATPPIEGIELCLTSDIAFDLPNLPAEIVIIGGGAVAIEFAYIFTKAGVKVTLVEMREELLGQEDADVSKALQNYLSELGVEIFLKTAAEQVSKGNRGFSVKIKTTQGEKELYAEQVMNAVGRLPNLDLLNLEKAGVKVERKAVLVNKFLQTAQPHIWAAGDAVGGLMFTAVAYYEGELAAKNALGESAQVDYSVVPRATFFHPQVASVGLTEGEVQQTGLPYVVGKYPYAGTGAAICDGVMEGFVKLVVEKPGGRILGAHIFGEAASELIQIVSVAMKSGGTVEDLAAHIFIHPTLAEVVGEAALVAASKLS